MNAIGPLSDDLEYRQALRSVRAAKNVFVLLILAALLVQLAGFCLVRFGVVPLPSGCEATTTAPAAWTASASAPASQPAARSAAACAAADMLVLGMHWALPATKFLAMVLAILLAITLLVSVQLAILGRTGGAAAVTSGFFWSLLLLMVLVPWQQFYGGNMATGATFNFGTLLEGSARVLRHHATAPWDELAYYYARFAGYPVIALLLLLLVQAKFHRFWRTANPPQVQAEEMPAPRPEEPGDKI